jgi:hypothetical protein
MVHKPKHKVHSFRGKLGDGGQDEIELERQTMNVAFRIVKFQIFWANNIGADSQDSLVTVWREAQTGIPISTPTLSFKDPDLLAAANLIQAADSAYQTAIGPIIFDNVLFSRNLYVNHTDAEGAYEINWYLELEEVPVSASTLMQLKLGVARKLDLSQSPPDA